MCAHFVQWYVYWSLAVGVILILCLCDQSSGSFYVCFAVPVHVAVHSCRQHPYALLRTLLHRHKTIERCVCVPVQLYSVQQNLWVDMKLEIIST